ncbi:cation transporter [Gallaecimonas sp. GXIMD1310]|uniref:cation transporter n=1 Tax=Gallaecimonas sp. GXIMD1310 TaxID=3131926 RepID=UPI003249272E
MSSLQCRPGVRAAYRVERKLTLSGHQGRPQVVQAAVAQLDDTAGVDGVALQGERLWLAYDASVVNIDKVREILAAHQLRLVEKGWAAIKLGYYRFVDQNISDNATHEPWCCHRLPPNVKK